METRDLYPWATLDRAGEGYEDEVKDEPLSDEPWPKRTLKERVLMHQKATLEFFGKDNWMLTSPPAARTECEAEDGDQGELPALFSTAQPRDRTPAVR